MYVDMEFKPGDPQTIYAATRVGMIYKSTDGGITWAKVLDDYADGGRRIELAVSSNQSSWIYAVESNSSSKLFAVYKSTDQGSSWTKISTMSSSSKIRNMAVAPSNSQVIYAADPSHLWVTTDGGTSWSDITGTLPVSSSSITYVSVKNDDPNTAWVSMGQYNSDGVFETTDGGTTWTNISTGLPQVPVMCVVQNTQETTVTELYAGTDLGVYVKYGNSGWTSFNNGLPNVVVNELEIYYDNSQALSKIRAATSGRGLWESDLYSPPNSPPEPEFTVDIRIPQTNQTVAFSDLSTNIPTSWQWSFPPSTVSYQNGTTSASQNPEVKFTATGLYEVKLVASNAYGGDSISKSAYIRVDDYCAASGSGDIYIDDVEFGTISNSGTGNDGYTDYNNLSTEIKIGSSYSISIHFGKAYTNDTVAGWIDWNQDGDFDDAGEEVFWIDVHYYTVSSTVTVPDDALLGYTRMRIRNKHFGAHYSPCGTTSRGEVEYYAVEVLPEENVWTGTTAQWNAESNWSKGVIPTMSYNVIIPASPSGGNFPVIPPGYTAKCNKLTLQNGATITVNGHLQVNQ